MTSRLERDVRILKAALGLLSALVLFLLVSGLRTAGGSDVISVERINVVEPDGRIALVISNGARIPGPRFDGEELSPEISEGRIGSAGLVFYNDRGDEVGGLIFHGDDADSGSAAHAALAFDQYRQDQVVSMQYVDDGQSRSAGLHVWDRSTEMTIGELYQLSRQAGAGGSEEAEQARQQLTTLGREGALGAPRVFLGSRDKVAELVINDTRGRPRLRMKVDAAGGPAIEVLDSIGHVVARMPEN